MRHILISTASHNQWLLNIHESKVQATIERNAPAGATVTVYDKPYNTLAVRGPVKQPQKRDFAVTPAGGLQVKTIKPSSSTLDAICSGKFITVQWVKKDGEVTTHSARYGVKKYLKSQDSKAKHDPEKYILVWCRESGGLRFNQPRLIKRDSILAIKAEGYNVKVNIASPWAKMIQA